jgi:hypothetical protein
MIEPIATGEQFTSHWLANRLRQNAHLVEGALVQKIKQLQWVVVGLETYTQDFAYCENFAPEPSGLAMPITLIQRSISSV